MNAVIQAWIEDYKCRERRDYELALKEILQHIALLGLSRGGFFERADFYGGTALRIFHSLPRFSEDLDFTLKKVDPGFKLKSYFKSIKSELSAYGFDVSVEEVEKQDSESEVESAFLKAGTKIHFLKIDVASLITDRVQHNEVLKVKFEIDIEPSTSYETEVLPLLRPVPFSVGVLKPSSLFAGKMHALLFRKWKTRVKGRDFFDFIFYVSRGVPVRLAYLEEKMRMGGAWQGTPVLTRDELIRLYLERVKTVDFAKAKTDVAPFVADQKQLEIWSTDFFLKLADRIKVE